MARPPPTIVAASVAAILVGALDAVDVVLGVLAGGTGAIVGTLVRDALLVLGALVLLRRTRWAIWVLGPILALAFLRALVADDWLEWAGLTCALAAVILLVLPPSRDWIRAPS